MDALISVKFTSKWIGANILLFKIHVAICCYE